MTKALVSTPFIPISKFPHSHRGAQGVIYADMIRATGLDVTCNMSLDLYHEDFNAFDQLWVYHGNDWTNHLNLFGGLQNFPYAFNFENFCRFKGPVFSLGIDFPDYHSMLHHKIDLAVGKGKPVQPEWLRIDWDNLKRMQAEAVTVVHPNPTNRLVIGDSHAICLYRPGWTMESIPFKTLHGALNIGLENLLPAVYGGDWDAVSEVDLYFGNIDIRHHICRQEDPSGAVRDLAVRYVDHAVHLAEKGCGRRVRIYEPLPIENESRTIPKTGYYDGKPFHGTWEERNKARFDLAKEIETLLTYDRFYKGRGVELVRWTGHLFNSRGELDFKKMERPKSIHLSRAAYPYWQGVDWNGPQDDTIEDIIQEAVA